MNFDSDQQFDPADEKLMRLSEYLDGTLDPQAAAELERELAADESLAAELEELKAVDQLVRDHGKQVPELDWERFTWQARLKREAEPGGQVSRIALRHWRPLAAAASIAILITSGIFFSAANNGAGKITGTPLALVTLQRPAMELSTQSAPSLAIVEVSTDVPANLQATVKPPPVGKTIIVSVGVGDVSIANGYEDEDIEAIF